MIIFDIIKSTGKAIRDRRKRIDKVLDKFEYLQDRVEGILSFSGAITEMQKQIAVIQESIGMIKSFFNIHERRKVNLKVKKDRRKNNAKI